MKTAIDWSAKPYPWNIIGRAFALSLMEDEYRGPRRLDVEPLKRGPLPEPKPWARRP